MNYPRKLGVFQGKEVEANIGRFGPYIRFGETFISLDKSLDVFSITFEEAKGVIEQKQKADAPISVYDGKEVTKGGRSFLVPFIKWNNIFY